MSWFRMYTEVLNDPKAQRLSGDDFKGWVNLLCLAKEHDGTLPPLPDIAFALRMSEKQAGKLLDTLLSAGLLDDTETGVEPHNWSGRQYKSDVSTERVKRFRKRSAKQDEAVTATPPETESETDTETEEKVMSKAPPLDAKKSPSRKKKKAREYDAEFLAWWGRYPRREAKGDAYDAYWTMRDGGHSHEVLMAGSVYAADKYAERELQYIPLPATFLRREQFLEAGEEVNGTGPPEPPEHLSVDERIDWWKRQGVQTHEHV